MFFRGIFRLHTLLYTCHMAWVGYRFTCCLAALLIFFFLPRCLLFLPHSLFFLVSLSFYLSHSHLSVTLRLPICQCASLSSPLPPALPGITGFPPLQSAILFHGNWLSMRGSDGGVGGGGGEGGGRGWGWEEALLLENGAYLHYMRTECSES